MWVSPALHTGNFAGLLTDLYVAREHRTFRLSSSILAAVINLIYMAFWYISTMTMLDILSVFTRLVKAPAVQV